MKKRNETKAYMSLVPFASAALLRAADISVNLVKTDFTLPPVSMEMMRQWSSSFTQHKAVLASLWKIPRSCTIKKCFEINREHAAKRSRTR